MTGGIGDFRARLRDRLAGLQCLPERKFLGTLANDAGSVAVVTNLRQTRSTDGKVTTAPVRLLDALLGEGIIRGSLPATPPS